MDRNIELDDPEGYTLILDRAEELSVSANTFQQMGSRGVFRTQKINGLLYVEDVWIPRIKKLYGERKVREMIR